jgi:hypothetical protein
MRGDIVHRVYGVHRGRADDTFFGAFRTLAEATARIDELEAKEDGTWAPRYHDRGFAIRPFAVDTDFEIPPLPTPRDRYVVRTTPAGRSFQIDVLRRGIAGLEPVCGYERNHTLFDTFEPFRQGGRELALVSRDYTCTAVLDLASGELVAEEPPSPGGFCPVGFYVPDWWDVHDGSIIPGSEFWSADREWPTGDVGFVWGCQWGDDSSWKVQHLDLSRVQEGVLRRDDRFGYLELATRGWTPPWRAEALAERSVPPPFIRVARHQGKVTVRFDVEMEHDLASGAARDWTRTRVSNLE